MLNNEDCDGRPIGPIYEARTWGARRGNYLEKKDDTSSNVEK